MKFSLLISVLIFSVLFTLYSCQENPIDAKCYYKAPDLHIQNNNSYDWTDILITIKVKKDLFESKRFVFQMKNFTSGNDTTLNLNDIINKIPSKSALKDFKVNIVIVTFQGKFSSSFIIKKDH
jgi:hypothetical protein